MKLLVVVLLVACAFNFCARALDMDDDDEVINEIEDEEMPKPTDDYLEEDEDSWMSTDEEEDSFTSKKVVPEDPPVYSKWSKWSRCEKCWQRRQKSCLKGRCTERRIFEERPCTRRRCWKQKRRQEPQQLHIVHLDNDTGFSMRSAKPQVWGSWSEWTLCNKDCRTFRYRMCKKPGRCKKKKQRQAAYCYHEKSKCEYVVVNLISSRLDRGNQNRYVYTYQEPAPPPQPCGRPNRKSKMLKIIGGKESKKHKWPWHVAVINSKMEVFCAGTLIHPRWVLTAAHCVRRFLKVRLNEFDLRIKDGRELELIVQKMFVHPRFNQQTVDNDIALLRLRKPVGSPVACLPNTVPQEDDLCWIMGWGKINVQYDFGSPKLIEAQIPVVNRTVCTKAYRHYYLTDNMFCSGWRDGRSDTCAGDSGGGLMCPMRKGKFAPYTVQGITSFGDGCGRKNKFGIYTKVYNYIKWIKYVVDNHT